jgi:Zn-dependent peptidase ImmA (M78 family)
MTVPGPAVTDVPGAVRAALELRDRLGVGRAEPLPCVMTLAEDHLDLDVVVARLPQGCSGFYLPRPEPKRGLVATNGTHAVVRQRFTVAHEVGHHVLGHGAAPRVVALAETPSAVEVADGPAVGEAAAPRGGADPSAAPDPSAPAPPAPTPHVPRRSSDPRERAANAFAAELLCPADGARRFVAEHAPSGPDGRPVVDFDLVVRLSCAFGISAASVLTRLETAEIMRDPPLRAALQARVDATEHLPRYRELGLLALRDELQLVADVDLLPRLPEGVSGDDLLAVTDPDRPTAPLSDTVRELRRLLGLDGAA